MSVGAAGTAGFQVPVNPGNLLCFHREGSRGGNNRPAQLVRAFDLVGAARPGPADTSPSGPEDSGAAAAA
jgi:hypothetical protein